jgi:hypothetical protein
MHVDKTPTMPSGAESLTVMMLGCTVDAMSKTLVGKQDDRRHFNGDSDARIIMGQNEKASH